ncbi:uncharacterized protein [Parasteatoda tepidariorum]|uniref:uncharacterized protein isoform X1 n=2 Tax=Parasteatoda tepidariorum TaxID=114398 RepID=UPI001C71FC02|nr:uncharacterized protein LOC107448972 isoform X1 [Parasteatoda tepidariorum]
MPKRKLVKFSSSEAAPKLKVPKSDTFTQVDNIELNSKCWLQSLPNEVLELIYSFLPLRALIAVESLKCGRISDLIRKTRFADFSSCNDILPTELQQFISSDITRHIREINFTSIFLVNTSDLVKVIVRCKHLTSLTVVDCGVTFDHMQRILAQCKQLKKLCWDVLATVGEESDTSELSRSVLQITKLHFYIDCPKSSEIGFFLLRLCPAVSEVCFNYTSLLSPHLPLRTCHKNIVYKLHSHPVCPVNIILDDYFENVRSVYDCIMATKCCHCPNPVGSLHMPMTAPYLQVVASAEDYPSLALIPEKSVPKLVLYYSNKIFLRQKFKDIKRVIGKNLTVLAVKEIEILSTEVDTDDEEEDKISMTELVSNLISDCCSIQVLILSPIHFNEPLKLDALHCLTGLRTLILTSCAFNCDRSLPFSHTSKVTSPQQKSFEELVRSIKDVEHFSIINCEHCCPGHGPKDKELSAISKWNRLKSLSLVNVESLQFCTFLRDIAVECPNFKSLEILNPNYKIVHNYISNVMSLLIHSPQLMQLCINVDVLCIKNQRFWDSISSAKNLQSLCLTLRASANFYPKPLADAIEKLPLLHVFHLNSPTIHENIALRVTRIMKRHGVKYPKVEVTTVPSISSNQTYCDSPHIYIA